MSSVLDKGERWVQHMKNSKDNAKRILKIFLIIFFFIIFDFMFYYLLTLNIILYKRNKKNT